MLLALGRSLRRAATPRWPGAAAPGMSAPRGVRTEFSISLAEFPAELAVARLNRKVQRAGLMTKWRRRSRGFVKRSKVKYDARLKQDYKRSYRRVQDVLTWIEMERMLSASNRQARRKASRAAGPAAAAGGGGPP
jgi:hypothetical protein